MEFILKQGARWKDGLWPVCWYVLDQMLRDQEWLGAHDDCQIQLQCPSAQDQIRQIDKSFIFFWRCNCVIVVATPTVRYQHHNIPGYHLLNILNHSSTLHSSHIKGRPKNSSCGTKLLCTPTSKSCSLFETPWFNRQMMLLLIPCKKIASQHDCKNDCRNEFANMLEFLGIRKA